TPGWGEGLGPGGQPRGEWVGETFECGPSTRYSVRSMDTPSMLAPVTVAPRASSGYPEPYRSRVLPREKRALGDVFGLTKVGVNMTTLPPGKESSMRHCPPREDEMVFVLEGEVVLRDDAGERVLTSGMCA